MSGFYDFPHFYARTEERTVFGQAGIDVVRDNSVMTFYARSFLSLFFILFIRIPFIRSIVHKGEIWDLD